MTLCLTLGLHRDNTTNPTSPQVSGGKTLLHVLAETNNPETERSAQLRENQLQVFSPLVALLLFAGLNINASDMRGMTCLHSAAKAGTGSFINTLLKRGADPHKLARGQLNVLHFAASNHNTPAWEALLQALHDPFSYLQARNKAGASPSQLCSLAGNANGLAVCAKYLANHQTILQSPSLPRSFKELPPSSIILTETILKRTSKDLITAICRGMTKADISQLLNGKLQASQPNGISSPFTSRSKHSTWLHFCCKYSAESSILALLHFDATSAPDSAGLLPFHYALRRCFPLSCVELARHMSLELWSHLDKQQRSLLHWICTFAAPPPYFIKHDSSVIPTQICSTWDPLWYFLASSKPKGSNQTYLVHMNSNRDLTRPDSNGNQPIHLLAQRDITGKALDLYCQSSDPAEIWTCNRNGHSVLHLVARNRAENALSALLHHLRRIAEPGPEAVTAEAGVKDQTSSTSSTASTSAATPTSTPPSITASWCSSNGPSGSSSGSLSWPYPSNIEIGGKRGPELVSYLLNQQDPMGRTPLHLAVKSGHVRSVQVLLEAKANISILDKKGLCIVALAAKYKSLMVLIQLAENGVCTMEEAKMHLSDMGFRSAIPELEAMKHDMEQLRLPTVPSSDTMAPKTIVPALAMASALTPAIDIQISRSASPPLDRKVSSLHGQAMWPLALNYGSSNTVETNYDVREGEKFPLPGRRSGSAPANSEHQFFPGRLSPRDQASSLAPLTSSSCGTSPSVSTPFFPTNPASLSGKHSPLSASQDGGLLVRDSSLDSLQSIDTINTTDVNSEGSADGETVVPGVPGGRLRINLERIPTVRQLPNRSSSTSPPRSPAQSNNPFSSNWGPPSPTSAPMSPRSISPRSRTGNVTPPGTPTSSGFDRMKLQRSLSPRSLPTIKEVNPDAGKEGETPKEGKDKEGRASAKRHRSGSNSSLKKALMLRSRSLTKLPTNPGDDFLEAIKPTAPTSGYAGGPSGSYTLHPGSLESHFNNIMHTRSHSDQSNSGDTPSLGTSSSTHTVTTTKRRHKSSGKRPLQSSDSSA